MDRQWSLLAYYLRELAVLYCRLVDNLSHLLEHGETWLRTGLEDVMVDLLQLAEHHLGRGDVVDDWLVVRRLWRR